jgi:hypothetical protein
MAVTSSSLRVGHCYVTPLDDVRQIVEFERNLVSYVVRGKLAFPAWDGKNGSPPRGKYSLETSRAKCRAIGDRLRESDLALLAGIVVALRAAHFRALISPNHRGPWTSWHQHFEKCLSDGAAACRGGAPADGACAGSVRFGSWVFCGNVVPGFGRVPEGASVEGSCGIRGISGARVPNSWAKTTDVDNSMNANASREMDLCIRTSDARGNGRHGINPARCGQSARILDAECTEIGGGEVAGVHGFRESCVSRILEGRQGGWALTGRRKGAPLLNAGSCKARHFSA